MARALVTGATGFIGYHLVKRLVELGYEVTCLVRPSSDRSRLACLNPRFVEGDINDEDSIRRSLKGIDVVYHLAGATKALSSSRLMRVNEVGTRNVASQCASMEDSPTLVLVSSMAAAGPAVNGRPRIESDEPSPVSAYGRSKRSAELAVRNFATRVPTTIVRPPIVLGEGDRDGFNLFEGIAKWGVHLVPGLSDRNVSVIHATDLADALILLAKRGRRVSDAGSKVDGCYFVSDRETPTYAHLGRMIGQSLGRSRIAVVRNPNLAVWSIAAFNEVISQIRRRPHILNLDKAREATAGAWVCSSDKLRRETGFEPAESLQRRFSQTAKWYLDAGWLKPQKRQHARPAREAACIR